MARVRKRFRGRKTSFVRGYARSIGRSYAMGGATYRAASYAKGVVPKYGNMKLKAVFQCSADGSGIMNHGFRITQPDNFDGTGSSVTDWTSCANLYDEYRVRGLKLKFVPQRPNDVSQNTTAGNVVNYQPVYVLCDFDSTGLNPTVATCVGYDNMRVKDLTRPWKAYFSIPKLANYSSATISRPGWMDTASTTSTGAVYMHSESLTASLQYGKIILTYYVTFHNRK